MRFESIEIRPKRHFEHAQEQPEAALYLNFSENLNLTLIRSASSSGARGGCLGLEVRSI
jgi:hypothetical protein